MKRGASLTSITATSNPVVPDDDVLIRRYIKLNSFLELLCGQLVQVRTDAFDDPAEGAYFSPATTFTTGLCHRLGLGSGAHPHEVIREARLHALATCWYEGARESFAMWNVYGRMRESVAIESTVGNLKAALGKLTPNVRVERVRYSKINWEIDDYGDLFFHKQPEYAYEQEVRSIWTLDSDRVGSRVHNTHLSARELGTFIQRIIVAPGSRRMFYDAIVYIVQATFHMAGVPFARPIEHSSLDSLVVYQQPK
jgi:hypothetical protein